MGVKIESAETVAAHLLNAVAAHKRVYVMGGVVTRGFAALNAASPRLADMLILNRYKLLLRTAFDPAAPPSKPAAKAPRLRTLGLILIALSFVLYGVGLAIVPLLSIDLSAKAVTIPALLGLGELTFWGGAAMVGGEAVRRIRSFDVCRLFCAPAK